MAEATAIFELQIEARRGAELADGRRIHRDDDGLTVRRESGADALDQCLRAQIRALAQRPVPEMHEEHSLVLTTARVVVAVDLEHRVYHARLLMQQIAAHIVERGTGTTLRAARRTLYLHEQVALIFIGQKGRGQVQEQHCHHGNDGSVDEKPATGPGNHVPHAADVMNAAAVECSIEPREETPGRTCVATAQEHGAERRREAQSNEHGQRHGRNDGQRELAIDSAD